MAYWDLGNVYGGSRPRAKKTKKKAKRKTKKKAKKKAKRKTKKKARKKTRKKAARKKLPSFETKDAVAYDTCNRSPCGAGYDPKIQVDDYLRARAQVESDPGTKLHREVVFKVGKNGKPEVQGEWVKIKGRRGKGRFVPTYKRSRGGVYRPHPTRPLVVAYGLGLDSTAILCGLVQEMRRGKTARERKKWVPSVITFADTGAEKDSTYSYLEGMNAYLVEHGFPPVTVVAWRTAFTSGGWGGALTLEQQVLINQSGPSITEYFGAKSKCSSLWKQQPQDDWMKHQSGMWERVKVGKRRHEWRPKGGWIVKAIGYDATEERRMAPDGGGTGATFRATEGDKGYWYWYPLVEWGWDRARCKAEVELELGPWTGGAPPKSSCFFCFAMKPEEIVSLSRDEAKRAAFMELVRRHGRQAHRYRFKQNHGIVKKDPKKGVKGLAGGWAWVDLFLYGAVALRRRGDFPYSLERCKQLDLMVREFHKRPTVLTKNEVAQLDRAAEKMVSLSADKGKSIRVRELSQAEVVRRLGFLPKASDDLSVWRKVYKLGAGKAPPAGLKGEALRDAAWKALDQKFKHDRRADVNYKGTYDVSQNAFVRSLPAFSDLKGFRGGPQMTWARNPSGKASRFTSHTLEVPTDLYGIAYPLG